MQELDAIQLWYKLEQKAKDLGLRLDIMGSIQIFTNDDYLGDVKSVEALEAFLLGYELGKTGDIPTQHDSI